MIQESLMANESAVHQWISRLGLSPHPEGGFYRQSYKSVEIIAENALPVRFTGRRSFSTSIYFLMTSESFSAFHRIKQDELWHFYSGSPLTIHSISPEGIYSKTELGCNPEKNLLPQAVIPASTCFAASVNNDDAYSLTGCTVAPGFEFADFELVPRKTLLDQYPEHRAVIEQYTRN